MINWKRSANPLTSSPPDAPAGPANGVTLAEPSNDGNEVGAELEDLEDLSDLSAPAASEPASKAKATMDRLLEIGPPPTPPAANASPGAPPRDLAVPEPGAVVREARKLSETVAPMPDVAAPPSGVELEAIQLRLEEANASFEKSLADIAARMNSESDSLRATYAKSIGQMQERLTALEEAIRDRDARIAAQEEEAARLRAALKKVISEAFEIVKEPELRR